jgi:hypothetical protein
MFMAQAELTALRDVLDLTLRLPANIRTQLAAWLAPEAAKPNGADPHPPPRKDVSRETSLSPRRSPTPAGKTRRGKPPSAKTAEQKLIAALQASPGASERALATAVGANRSTVGEHLRQLARDGMITKDAGGHWKLTADLAGEEARPTQPSPAAS